MSSATSNTGPPMRRVITGVGKDGKAQILYDDTKGLDEILPGDTRVQTLWWTDSVPADLSEKTNGDPTVGPKNFPGITNNGSIGAVVWFPPGIKVPIHSTPSMDYGLILEGELELELDSGDKTVLKPGDVLVQREAKHGWYNPHPTQYAKVFFVCVASTNAGKF